MLHSSRACPQCPHLPRGRLCLGLGSTEISYVTHVLAKRICPARSRTHCPQLLDVLNPVPCAIAADNDTITAVTKGEEALIHAVPPIACPDLQDLLPTHKLF